MQDVTIQSINPSLLDPVAGYAPEIIPRHFVCYLYMWRSVARMDVFFKCLNCSEELEETYQYCSRCAAAVDKEEVLIGYNFKRGFDYSVILLLLDNKYHATEMSMRTLHDRLREYRLRRRNANSDDAEIYEAIQQELDGPGRMMGYRAMWHTLRLDYGIQAPRRKVEGILRQVDPEGTALRKAHAPKRRSYTVAIGPGPAVEEHHDPL